MGLIVTLYDVNIWTSPTKSRHYLPSTLTYIDSEDPKHLLRNYISYKNILNYTNYPQIYNN
jgi:hypothetical protein